MKKNVINESSTTTGVYSYTPYNYVDECINEIHEYINDSNHTLQDKVTATEDTLKGEIWWVQSEQRELLKVASKIFYAIIICSIMFGAVAIFQILCTCRMIQDIQAVQTTTQEVQNVQ